MNFAIGVLFSVLYLVLFWYAYILVMGLYRAHLMGRLTGLAMWMAAPAVAVGWAMDVIANLTFATVAFWEKPTRWNELVTDRLTRHVTNGDGWRKRNAVWICTNLLDYMDPTGSHCSKAKNEGA